MAPGGSRAFLPSLWNKSGVGSGAAATVVKPGSTVASRLTDSKGPTVTVTPVVVHGLGHSSCKWGAYFSDVSRISRAPQSLLFC